MTLPQYTKKPIGQPVSFEDAGDLGDEGIVRVGVAEQGADREQNLKSKELKNTWPDRGGRNALQSITSAVPHQMSIIRVIVPLIIQQLAYTLLIVRAGDHWDLKLDNGYTIHVGCCFKKGHFWLSSQLNCKCDGYLRMSRQIDPLELMLGW